jgi:predicted glycoside hydrolase/deacetylase ChbG (UPF0249 family)
MKSKQEIKITVDDFGYKKSSDNLLIKLNQKGYIHHICVLPNFDTRSVLKLKTSRVPISLHLNLIEGRPLSPPSQIETLVDTQGIFYPFPLFFFRLIFHMIKKEHLEKEIENQMLFFKRDKILIHEVTSHQHTHALSPIAEIVGEQMKKYGISRMRTYGSIQTYTLKAYITYLLLRCIASITALSFMQKWLPLSWQKTAHTASIMSWESSSLDITQKKVDEIICHPGLPYDSNRSYESLFQENPL